MNPLAALQSGWDEAALARAAVRRARRAMARTTWPFDLAMALAAAAVLAPALIQALPR